ncbi:MAG: galactosyldiacylglycerol synthase, partial [Peptostreptococcus sp.]|nr:galactosyldiacylglycerol synthase [Peptostreptococcus sp.]
MKILILTAKYGMGHVSAANSIKEEIEKFHPGAQVEIVDFYEYSMPFLAKYMYKAFKAIVKYTQSFYIKFYEQNDREKTTTDIITKKFACMTSQIISEEKPDMIISTFPIISQGVGYYKEV